MTQKQKDKGVFIGLDVGSISLNTVVLDGDRRIIEEHYHRIHGRPLERTREVLGHLLSRYGEEAVQAVAVTGVGGKLVGELIGASFMNELVAQAKSVELLAPQVRTIIEMGGADAKLILLAHHPDNGRVTVEDFSMNTLCAAGTGSFLDQQASRLGLSIEEFSSLALKSTKPPRIAGRCSVFAKSDMIHLQQAATPDYDIVAGLCFAVARNFKGDVAKGRDIVPPVSFQGGVAANVGMVRAFREVLELSPEELIIPEHFASTGAIGAALMIMEDPSLRVPFLGIHRLEEHLKRAARTDLRDKTLDPLVPPRQVFMGLGTGSILATSEPIPAYLGVDVGSISTNVVIIDDRGEVLSKCYLMTAGRPLEAIKAGLKAVGEEVGERVRIMGAGTTGSGRYLTGDFIGADVIRNEITAQATAAVAIDPTVDTIFEIGGQDSKYISLKDGVVVDFAMNKVCAAGTGSFLEEQAHRLGISIEDEFAKLAFTSDSPLPLGERCTVFMESDIVHHLQRGAKVEDLVAGLAYSIVENYLQKVVEDRRIGNRIFFQGGPAFNKAIVSAFEKVLGREIIVPPHHEVTGAIGAAILAMRDNKKGYSNFKGFQLAHKTYELSTFECNGCPNQCEIKKVVIEGEEESLYYGGRCEKWEVHRGPSADERLEIPDLFTQRERLLMETGAVEVREDAPTVGIPRALFFHELLPFWRAFFHTLGYRVVLSDQTTREIIHDGVERVPSETCFPIKVAFGHVQNLLNKGVDRVFLPSIINLKGSSEGLSRGFHCPYVQTIPYTIKSSLDFEGHGVTLLHPYFHFGESDAKLRRELTRFARSLGAPPWKITRAIRRAFRAQESFYKALIEVGRRALESLPPDKKAMVLVSRVYNGCDPAVNLNVPRKLRDLGVLAIPLDALPMDGVEPDEEVLSHYWRYGQRFIMAAKLIREDPRLYPIYISNFGCGPDSFICHFFRNAMGEKPFLMLEIDEHSADVGAVTRLEAFLDSLHNAPSRASRPARPVIRRGIRDLQKERVIYLPYMSDHALTFAAAFHACGVNAQVLPRTSEETLRLGRRFTTGKECYPCILTTGDMVAWALRPEFDRERSAFFMPGGSGPCRFGQYNRFHRLVLDEIGLQDVPIYSPVQDQLMYEEFNIMGGKFVRLGWRGVVAVDFLQKALLEVRPYETVKGEADRIYQHFLERLCEEIRGGNEEIFPILEEACRAFEGVPRETSPPRPVVGIVGEIYIRSNPFSNEDVIRKLEDLGAVVWVPPISEWLLYINTMAKRHALRDRNWKDFLRTTLKERFQKKDEHHMEEIFRPLVWNAQEPSIQETLKMASPYIHDSFEGETILSVGKAEDFYRKGVCGIVNVGPFTCMPTNIVNALLKRFRERREHIPVLTLSFDGQGESNSLTRLEAFMFQVHQYMERRMERNV